VILKTGKLTVTHVASAKMLLPGDVKVRMWGCAGIDIMLLNITIPSARSVFTLHWHAHTHSRCNVIESR